MVKLDMNLIGIGAAIVAVIAAIKLIAFNPVTTAALAISVFVAAKTLMR